MLELAVFLIIQLVINLVLKNYVGKSAKVYLLSLVIAGYLAVLYPVAVMQFIAYMYMDTGIKCWTPFIGLFLFLWIIGLPLALLLQFIYIRYLFKYREKTFEKSVL